MKVRDGTEVIHVRTRTQPTRYLLAKLHKDPVAFRSITTCFATTTEGAGKLVHACLAGMLPTLHTLWREAGIVVGVTSAGCWITTGGEEILTVVQDADRAAHASQDFRPHVFETYDFVAMYTNIPLVVLLADMKELLDLVFDYQLSHYGHRSISVGYFYENDTMPRVFHGGARWSSHAPISLLVGIVVIPSLFILDVNACFVGFKLC